MLYTEKMLQQRLEQERIKISEDFHRDNAFRDIRERIDRIEQRLWKLECRLDEIQGKKEISKVNCCGV